MLAKLNKMEFSYKFNSEHLKYVYDQVWECRGNISVYSKLSEFEHKQVAKYIDKPKKVLDLGCGLGRAAIYLNYVLNDPNIHFILADTTGDTKITGVWDTPEYYNNLSLTESFAKLNGLTNFETFDILKDDWNKLSDIDLIISHCSVGMHFPIEDVMPKLLKISTDTCTMIFGTTTAQMLPGKKEQKYSEKSFTDIFKEVHFQHEARVHPFPQQDWLVLKNKI